MGRGQGRRPWRRTKRSDGAEQGTEERAPGATVAPSEVVLAAGCEGAACAAALVR